MRKLPRFVPFKYRWKILDKFTKRDLANIVWSLAQISVGLDKEHPEIWERLEQEDKALKNSGFNK